MIEIHRMRLTPGRRPLVRCHPGIALHETHAIDGDRELFGHQLCLHRRHALAHVRAAGVHSYGAVAADRDPGVERLRRVAALREHPFRRDPQLARELCDAECDDERPGALEEVPARETAATQLGERVLGHLRFKTRLRSRCLTRGLRRDFVLS